MGGSRTAHIDQTTESTAGSPRLRIGKPDRYDTPPVINLRAFM